MAAAQLTGSRTNTMTTSHNSDRYDINVSVQTQYIPEQSDPDNERHVFSYTITIENTGAVPAQLQSRHWFITDADGQVQEVVGEGVVGEKPRLEPGESYQYTSGTVLRTAVGSMHGTYTLVADDGHPFDAEIPPFGLAIPNTLH